MRTNPLAERIRDRLQPQFAAFADPLHPDRVLVARRSRDGKPDAKRVAATVERRDELNVFNPIFRDSPATPEQWRADWESGALARLADAGGPAKSVRVSRSRSVNSSEAIRRPAFRIIEKTFLTAS